MSDESASQDLAMFQAVIDTAREAVLWVDEDGRFVYLNQRAWSWLGYAPAELAALRIWDVDRSQSRAQWLAAWQQTPIDASTEASYRRRDGSLVPVEVSARYLQRSGRRLWAAFVRDVADQRAVMEDVVFMSGYAPNLVEGAHASDEPLRFIQKPFTMAELARSVESALRAGAQRPGG